MAILPVPNPFIVQNWSNIQRTDGHFSGLLSHSIGRARKKKRQSFPAISAGRGPKRTLNFGQRISTQRVSRLTIQVLCHLSMCQKLYHPVGETPPLLLFRRGVFMSQTASSG